jgi:hypothetical protein
MTAENDKRHEKYIESLLKDKPASYYKIEINPITPSEGITTGHVIAYGHYIKPPYKVEVRDTCVFINNVQVWPPLQTKSKKEEDEKNKKTVDEIKSIKAIERATLFYDSLINCDIKPLVAMGKTVGYIKLQKDFEDSIISYDEEKINVYYKRLIKNKYREGTLNIMIKDPYNKRAKGQKTQKVNISKNNLADQILNSHIVSLDKMKSTIIFGPNSEVSCSNNEIYGILNILKSKKSKLEKLKELEAITGDINGLMLLYNFNPSEWLNIKGETRVK